MEKKTQTIQEQQEYGGTPVHAPEELIQDEESGRVLAQTLMDGEKTAIEDADFDSVDHVDVEERVRKLTESLEWWDESEKTRRLDDKELTEILERALCYAYDVYLREKEDGEHCPTVSVGDYVFAARGFTCGHVDRVKVFKKIDKKVLFVFKKKEYVPVEVTMDIVNILAEAGGVLPPLDEETLQKL